MAPDRFLREKKYFKNLNLIQLKFNFNSIKISNLSASFRNFFPAKIRNFSLIGRLTSRDRAGVR
jgi:hypothetical protein